MMELWRSFVESNPQLFPDILKDELKESFGQQAIIFSHSKDFPAKHVDIAYQSQNRLLAAEILGRYLDFVRSRFVAELVDIVKDKIDKQRESIMVDLTMLRRRAELSRQDEIERLRQDLALAETLNIHENMLVRSTATTRGVGSDIAIIATNETVKSYMRGTEVLNAELDALLKRKSNDPYIDGLREKQIELERLKDLQITPEHFMPYSVDGEIFSSRDPVKPKKGMIISLAIIFGLMSGVLIAFFVNNIASFREVD